MEYFSMRGKWAKHGGRWLNPDQITRYENEKNIMIPRECFFDIENVLREAEQTILHAPAEKKLDYLLRYFAFSRKVMAYYREKAANAKISR